MYLRAELRNPEAAEVTPTSITRHTASNSFSRGGIFFTNPHFYTYLSTLSTKVVLINHFRFQCFQHFINNALLFVLDNHP